MVDFHCDHAKVHPLHSTPDAIRGINVSVGRERIERATTGTGTSIVVWPSLILDDPHPRNRVAKVLPLQSTPDAIRGIHVSFGRERIERATTSSLAVVA